MACFLKVRPRRWRTWRHAADLCVLQQHIEVDVPPRRLVRDLRWTLRSSERWAVVGANGAGKSTVARKLLETWEEARGPTAYVSFDLQRDVLQQERKDFLESRYESRHLRATVASYLFPDCHPDDPDYDPLTWGYRPPRTRVSPLPVPYDAESSHPLLQKLEEASSSGSAGRLLHFFGLWHLRHRPLFGLSTGEGRKLLMVDALLKKPKLLILDEAFDGLDASSRKELSSMLESFFEGTDGALVMVVHRMEDLHPQPTHVLLLGQGDGSDYRAGPWQDHEEQVRNFLETQDSALEPVQLSPPASCGEPLVEFKDVTIEYGPVRVFDKLKWTVREGEKWVVLGGNGSGKTTLFDLITGENVLGYLQDIHLFGRKKGSGESIWDIKKQLGVISSELHMEFLIYSDPRFDRKVTAWEVACSGLFDSVGLYVEPTRAQLEQVLEWVHRLGLQDLVVPPGDETLRWLPSFKVGAMFAELSHGQQKLVLLCRALVKSPRLLLLDEPTHGLSGENRLLLLNALRKLAATEVAVVLITHREEEIAALGFPNVLRLGWKTCLPHIVTHVESAG